MNQKLKSQNEADQSTIVDVAYRAESMIDKYRSGKTLQQIGNEYGISRERVRQIIQEGLYCLIKTRKELAQKEKNTSNAKEAEIAVIPKEKRKEIKKIDSLIEVLRLSERSLNALRKNAIYYIEELGELSVNEIIRLKGVGKKSSQEILQKLSNRILDKKTIHHDVSNDQPLINFVDHKSKKEESTIVTVSPEEIKLELEKLKEKHKDNKFKNNFKDIFRAKEELLNKAEKSYSLDDFSSEVNISKENLKKYFPDVFNVVDNNQAKIRNKWSRYYVCCKRCATTTIHHRSYGYCRECYPKTDIFKETQKASRMRNIEKIKNKLRVYGKEYARRPEVIAKRRRAEDLKKFGGNREKAITRDNNKCSVCKISRKENQERYGKDLFVIHIDKNNKNNSLNNLKTLCWKCFRSRYYYRTGDSL